MAGLGLLGQVQGGPGEEEAELPRPFLQEVLHHRVSTPKALEGAVGGEEDEAFHQALGGQDAVKGVPVLPGKPSRQEGVGEPYGKLLGPQAGEVAFQALQDRLGAGKLA